MDFKPFSKKQLLLLTWWCSKSKYKDKDAIICDGAVRSGKTLCMSISFISWAFATFNNTDFAICGKTITSLRRNVITPLINILNSLGFVCEEKVSKSYIDISYRSRKNRFYLFGGKDEGSASLIQGITLAGLMLDEVALMPRSFVEQALARCSINCSKFFFNCNPEHPFHWFYKEWIEKANTKNTLYLHFKMEDNPSLSKDILDRYKSLYSGVFYDRFVLGKWVLATGLVYPMFNANNIFTTHKNYETYYISCDYGTVNPASFGLFGKCENKWYRISEYYYNSKEHFASQTDEEYYCHLKKLAANFPIEAIIVDPSAASFIECIRRHNDFKVLKGKNDVLTGIRAVADLLKSNTIMIHSSCKDSIREFATYTWEQNNKGDNPKKENDHAMDDIRYFVSTIVISPQDDFYVINQART